MIIVIKKGTRRVCTMKVRINKAFDRGYNQGYKDGKEAAEDDMCKYYNKHFNDVVNSSNDDAYQRGYKDGMQNPSSIGYQHGYEVGLQHGKELRVKEAECAYQCGMKHAWGAARKIVLTKENGGILLAT